MTLELLFPNFDQLIRTPADVQRLNEMILQLAVQGKLVPPNPNDEPASELLNRMRAKKIQLIERGQVDKNRSLPAVNSGEFPFVLPRGWSLVRLGELAAKLGAESTRLGGKAVYQDKGIKFIRSQNV